MKKLVSLLLVLCLVLGISCTALAVGAPKITRQPVSATTDKYGTLTLTFEATDFVPNDSSWHFVEPDTGKEWTGPELRKEMEARKEVRFELKAFNGKQKLVLTNVPKYMHGWEVYAVLVGEGFKVETDHIRIWYYGFDKDENGIAQAKAAATSKSKGKDDKSKKDDKGKSSSGTAASTGTDTAEPEDPDAPKIITVTADKVTLYPVDSRGNALEDQAASSITFEDSGSVAVRSDVPVKYWMINGIRIEPDDSNLTSFVLKNITSNLTISAKLQKTSGASSAEIDPDSPCEITCVGCSFTYHKGGLSSVTSGTVPMGATIIVFTTADSASKGFSVNGDAPEHQGSTSFSLKIEEDTTITVQ